MEMIDTGRPLSQSPEHNKMPMERGAIGTEWKDAVPAEVSKEEGGVRVVNGNARWSRSSGSLSIVEAKIGGS